MVSLKAYGTLTMSMKNFMNHKSEWEEQKTQTCRIAVIGGGAAGMMAAGEAAALGCSVTLFEKNRETGKKLRITGKGRCNVTNDCTPEEFFRHIPTNARFLYGAVHRFAPSDTMAFFEALGVPLKTERGGRVFPESDRAADIVGALRRFIQRGGCRTITEKVLGIRPSEKGWLVLTASSETAFDRIILCTGGLSYPVTGSDGDGYRFARSLGHTVTPLFPSLVPLETAGRYCRAMQGLSLKNVTLTVTDTENGKCIFKDLGEMLFTHFGVSGPLVLRATSYMDASAPDRYRLEIDLKPALDEKMLDARILSDFEKAKNKNLSNVLGGLLPLKMILPFIECAGISPYKKINAITKKERGELLKLMKSFPLAVTAFRPIEEAIVTRGGVSVGEVDPRTMESRLHPGLFFAGELLDVDGHTGGYNLQIAFSTAVAAAHGAAGSRR